MKKQTTVHIISHTHWDREWFLNSPFTSEWLVEFFDSLFTMLEKEPEYRFILDGQTLMIEDYLKELEKQGRNKKKYIEKLKNYVIEKRLLPGPYYLQPDWQLVSGESLIRNLLIGRKITGDLGACLTMGWMLDNFGQISQAVQIHKGFGLKGLFVWRGVEMDPGDVKLEFRWESPDGSALTAIYLLDSYRNAMRLADYPEILEKRIINEVEKLKPFASTSNILLMNGYDQETVPDDILPYIRSIRIKDIIIKQSTPEELIADIEDEHPVLPKLTGYLYSGRFISVFPGILSARIYLKIMNDRCMRLIEKYTEPIMTLSWIMGSVYNMENILSLWKLLLKNHPHDSICGVSVDDVHTDMERRFEKTAHLATSIAETELNKLTILIDTSKTDNNSEAYVVFNPSLSERESIITVKPGNDASLAIDGNGLILPVQKESNNNLHIQLKNIPACGYRTIYLSSSSRQEQNSLPDGIRIDEDNNIIENKHFKVQINDDGSLYILDKMSMITYKGLGIFEDGSDAGDTYNYSPALHDSVLLSSSRKAEIDIIEKGPIRCTIKIKIDLSIPEELSEDRKTRSKRLRVLPVVNYIRIESDSPLIRFRTLVKNTVKDHRLRVLFPTVLNTVISHAETQFDVVEHEIVPIPYDDDQIPANLKRVLLGAREPKPITSFPQRSFIDLTDGKRGVAVINTGLPEYEVIEDNNTIALTLFRSVGWLARADLLERTGDAGPMIYTPEAQCLREMEFNYALYFHKGDWMKGRVLKHSEDLNSPPVVIRTDNHPGELPGEFGFLKLESNDHALKVTALKISEDGEGLILRCFNPSINTIDGVLSSVFEIASAYYTDLSETVKEQIKDTQERRINFRAQPKEIVTLKIVLQRKNLIDKNTVFPEHTIIWPEDFLEIEDFSAYGSMPLITHEDISKEDQRSELIADKLKQANRLSERIEKKLKEDQSSSKDEIEAELHRARGELTTLERALLEAQLSLILSKKKFIKLNPKNKTYPLKSEKIQSICREIGFKLNKARVRKRIYDYLVEYYSRK